MVAQGLLSGILFRGWQFHQPVGIAGFNVVAPMAAFPRAQSMFFFNPGKVPCDVLVSGFADELPACAKLFIKKKNLAWLWRDNYSNM